MIQGHVFDAVLSSQVKAHPLYYVLDFFHGFVAPAFFFSSGIAYGVSTIRRWDEQIIWGTANRQRVCRYLLLIAVGYALHLPYFSLRKTLSSALPAEMNSLLQSDALQCIGVTLLLLQFSAFLLKRKNIFIGCAAIAGTAIVFSAPLIWSMKFAGRLPVWFAPYLNSETSSWFPLFPWSAYILGGVMFGYVFANAHGYRLATSLMWKNLVLSLGMIGVAWFVSRLPFDVYPAHDFWKSNPTMFIIRLSSVSILTSLVFLAEQSIESLPRIPLIIGKETFFIYILHLIIVYGSVINRGLAQWVGPTLSIFQSIGVFALVFVAIGLITILWHEWNSQHKLAAAYLQWGGAAIFLLAFVIRPW